MRLKTVIATSKPHLQRPAPASPSPGVDGDPARPAGIVLPQTSPASHSPRVDGRSARQSDTQQQQPHSNLSVDPRPPTPHSSATPSWASIVRVGVHSCPPLTIAAAESFAPYERCASSGHQCLQSPLVAQSDHYCCQERTSNNIASVRNIYTTTALSPNTSSNTLPSNNVPTICQGYKTSSERAVQVRIVERWRERETGLNLSTLSSRSPSPSPSLPLFPPELPVLPPISYPYHY